MYLNSLNSLRRQTWFMVNNISCSSFHVQTLILTLNVQTERLKQQRWCKKSFFLDHFWTFVLYWGAKIRISKAMWKRVKFTSDYFQVRMDSLGSSTICSHEWCLNAWIFLMWFTFETRPIQTRRELRVPVKTWLNTQQKQPTGPFLLFFFNTYSLLASRRGQ